MAHQILSTKLYIPPIQANFVRRPGLIQHLENGYQAGKRVTLVSAPAGFGKTTIIREWITATVPAKAYGWVSLDDGDNDPVRFLIYFVTAIQKVEGKIGRAALAFLQSPQIPTLTDLVETLINEISNGSKPFLIVLDDYHLIKNSEVHSLMQLILKRQPERLHLVLITREDPPLPLPRMRVQGQITEIRERDLRFSLSEAQVFLVEAMGLALSSEDVGRLEERTEGWAAGMQLAALALEEYPNEEGRQAFIKAFAGSNRLIVDYLISEVLQRQDDRTRQFLLSTSILERFCCELCDQVVFDGDEAGGSQSILETLELGNMFLVPLDNERHWFRYHHLFSEMLFHSLRRSALDQIPGLHRKASEWFEASGLVPEMMNHALASKDWDFVTALLNRHALPIIFQGYGSLVIEWCRPIPKAYLEKAPDISIYYAWALVLTFRNDFLEAVEEKLQIAGRAIERPDLPAYADVGQGRARVPFKDWVIGHTCVIRSQILLALFNTYVDPQELIDLSLKGLELLPEVEYTFRSLCKINLAHAELMRNNPTGAQEAFEKALPFMIEAGNFLGAVADIFYQARLAFYMGQPESAEFLCRQWKKKFAEMADTSALGNQAVPEIPATRGLDIVLCILMLERNQFDEAEHVLTKTLELLGWGSWMELHGFIELARLRFLRGNYAEAQETIQRMSRLGTQHAACAEAFEILFEVKSCLEEPNVRARAEGWVKMHAPNQDGPFALGIGPYHRDAEYFCALAWAETQITLGHPNEAASFIEPALECAQEQGLLFRIAELSIMKALIDECLGNLPDAMKDLEKALDIAETNGYTRFFDRGAELDRLLNQAVEMEIHSQYARQLLANFRRTSDVSKLSAPAIQSGNGHAGQVEPLSEREIEVLQQMATGLALAEVARRMYLSPNTLKAHTQNIYTKLDVHSRIEAINKARSLDLI